jgi:hypothetical protein
VPGTVALALGSLAAALSLALSPGAAAAAPPGTFRTSVVVGNPGAATAAVSLLFLTPRGASAWQELLSVPAGASREVYVPNIARLRRRRDRDRHPHVVRSARLEELADRLRHGRPAARGGQARARRGDARSPVPQSPQVMVADAVATVESMQAAAKSSGRSLRIIGSLRSGVVARH